MSKGTTRGAQVSANQLYAEVQIVRARIKSVSRIRWATLTLGVLCAACLPAGIGLAIWSNLHHIRLGGACAGLILTGLLLGSALLLSAAALSGRVVDLRGALWEREAAYQDAVVGDLGMHGGGQ